VVLTSVCLIPKEFKVEDVQRFKRSAVGKAAPCLLLEASSHDLLDPFHLERRSRPGKIPILHFERVAFPDTEASSTERHTHDSFNTLELAENSSLLKKAHLPLGSAKVTVLRTEGEGDSALRTFLLSTFF
jgi:hypothetical protein